METTKKKAPTEAGAKAAHKEEEECATVCMSAPEPEETLKPIAVFALDALAQIRARAEAVADAGSTHED